MLEFVQICLNMSEYIFKKIIYLNMLKDVRMFSNMFKYVKIYWLCISKFKSGKPSSMAKFQEILEYDAFE